ncbi:unnamed protein product [Trifolium pratense]|uniref:Uncharacterized protein n=1 Tax=Trifolium pratense TaxID=57577 RepID=A0ACB0KCB6_TRIPR|nr:unnamed protein product [Trifolium pratense]
MRSFSKNKLSSCFRPVVDIDNMLESKVAAHRSATKPVSKFSKSWIKVVLLETILNRRAHHKNRYGLDCFRGSKNNYSTHKKETKPSLSTLSTHSSSISSSKVSPSKNMCTKVEGKKANHGSTLLEKQKKFEFYAMCLVFISLVFTVFWGKLYGIILTSIFLYFFTVCNSNYSGQKNYYTKYGCKGHYGKCAQSELS